MRVCIGGTFNILHKGHKYLIDKAFEIAGESGFVFIGVTVGQILQNKKFITPYDKRVQAIEDYLTLKGYDKQSSIQKIYDRYGLAVKGEYDAIIVSPETLKNSEDINENRKRLGKKPLIVIEVPHILADDNKPISSTRIYDQEIDKNGNKL